MPRDHSSPQAAIDAAVALLGVAATATEAELRAAYLEQVRLHPPDREPERFEQVRDAHDLLRNPTTRARLVLQSTPVFPLTGVLGAPRVARRYAGPAAWMAVLKEARP